MPENAMDERELLTPEQIIAYRKNLQMGQRGFAKYVGVGFSSIGRWETGKWVCEKAHSELIRLKSDLNYAKENVKFIQDNLVRECGTCRHENHAQTCDSCKNSSLWEYRNG